MPIRVCHWMTMYKYIASFLVSALGVFILNMVRIFYPRQPDDTLLLVTQALCGLGFIFLGVFMFRGVRQGKL